MKAIRSRHASKLNVVLDQWMERDEENAIYFRVYIGNRKSIPQNIYDTYFKESIARRMLRYLLTFVGKFILLDSSLEFRSRVCRIPVAKKDDDTLLFSWKIEDAFHILRQSGFHLLALVNDGAHWSPCGVFHHLTKLNRVSYSMPIIIFSRDFRQFVLLDSREAFNDIYSG